MPYKAELPKNAQNKMYADALYNIIGNKKNLYVLSTDDLNSTDKINTTTFLLSFMKLLYI